MSQANEVPAGQKGSGGGWHSALGANRTTFSYGHDSTELVISAIERVSGKPRRRGGNGWRLCCPSCGGGGYKVCVTSGADGRTLLTCFSCHDTPGVLASVGLVLRDLYPARSWPETPKERRRAARAIRTEGWAAALEVLAFEAMIVQGAARQLARWQFLSAEDDRRLAIAVSRVDSAKAVLCGH